MTKKRSHSAENNFLLNLIKNKDNSDYLNKFNPENFDWDYLLEQAEKEGVFYPVYERLISLDSQKSVLNDKARNKLRRIYYSYISQSTGFSNQVNRVLYSIESSGLRILLLKGPAVDSLIYKDLLRPRLDLDFTVEQTDVVSFQNLLSSLGYYPDIGEKDYLIPEYVNSRIYSKEEPGALPLHIHRHIINNLYLMIMDNMNNIGMDRVWQEARSFKDYNYIFCLKPELQLLYMCEHALKHNFERLIFLYEIDRVIDYYRDQIIWDKLVSLANEFKLGFALYYGLYFVREILSSDIPQSVLEILKPRKVTLGEKIFMKLTLNGKHITYLSYIIYISAYDGWPNKVRFLLKTIFPPGFTMKGYIKRLRRFFVKF